MKFQLDRDLPVPLAVQLRGQIEYAISCGELKPGSQLSPVRELAEVLGVSPVTVLGVYKALQEKKLLLSKPGQGTFVTTELSALIDTEDKLYSLNRMIDQLLGLARNKNIDSYQLMHMIQVRQAASGGTGIRLLFVGIFAEATEFYAAQIRRELGSRDYVEAITLSALAKPDSSLELGGFDLALTSRHYLAEAEKLLPTTIPVSAVSFIPAEATRAMLAQLEPMTRVGVVATYPEFMGVLKSSVGKFAPHVDVVTTALVSELDIQALVGPCDVVVYATGSEAVLSELPASIPTFEYRHIPDPRDFRHALQPHIEQVRRQKAMLIKQKTVARLGNAAHTSQLLDTS